MEVGGIGAYWGISITVYCMCKVADSLDQLKELSHEMDLAFDDMYG